MANGCVEQRDDELAADADERSPTRSIQRNRTPRSATRCRVPRCRLASHGAPKKPTHSPTRVETTYHSGGTPCGRWPRSWPLWPRACRPSPPRRRRAAAIWPTTKPMSGVEEPAPGRRLVDRGAPGRRGTAGPQPASSAARGRRRIRSGGSDRRGRRLHRRSRRHRSLRERRPIGRGSVRAGPRATRSRGSIGHRRDVTGASGARGDSAGVAGRSPSRQAAE